MRARRNSYAVIRTNIWRPLIHEELLFELDLKSLNQCLILACKRDSVFLHVSPCNQFSCYIHLRDADAADLTPQPTKKKIKTSGGFKDFSSW